MGTRALIQLCSFFLCLLCFLVSPIALAQNFRLRDVDTAKVANSVLALMSYSAIPDLASSSLSIDNAQTGNPSITMTQIGGGATVADSPPVYLEGAIAYSRYDPIFYATNGTETRELPLKWNSGVLQGGVGWDFPVAEDLVFRPIFNFALGLVASDLEVTSAFLGAYFDKELDFLDGGSLTVGGMGGSAMLDYEYSDPYLHDIDVELRYSFIHLQSMGGSSSVAGYSDSSTASLYYRRRAPISNWTAMKKPFRSVLEGSFSYYFGDQAGVLGFDYLASVGLGAELDSSNYSLWITRTRLVGRYMFGPNVRGYSIGLACSF